MPRRGGDVQKTFGRSACRTITATDTLLRSSLKAGLIVVRRTQDSSLEGISQYPTDATTQSFVVRIWLEEVVAGKSVPTWRGHITHVPDGRRLYITELNGIVTFITPYLEKMGVHSGFRWRLRHWLNRWRP